MVRKSFLRVIILNFASALIIAGVGCYFLRTFNLNEVLYIGNLFGLYFLTVYGMEILIDAREIGNNAQRFMYLLIFIAIFDIIFMIVMPLIFGSEGFNASDALTLVFNGVQFDFILSTLFYLSIFALLMIIFNIILYRQELGLMGE